MSKTTTAIFLDRTTNIFVYDSADGNFTVARLHIGDNIVKIVMPMSKREAFIHAIGEIRVKGLTERYSTAVTEPVVCYSIGADVDGELIYHKGDRSLTFVTEGHLFMLFTESVKVDIYVMW